MRISDWSSDVCSSDLLVIHDELIHASAHDGMKLGRAGHVAAAHNDAQAFADIITRWRAGGGAGTPWIAVESLYSMDGDRARSEERRGGTACVSTCTTRWPPDHKKHK